MPAILTEWLFDSVCTTIWYLIHITYQIQLIVRGFVGFNVGYLKGRLRSCVPLQSPEKQLSDFVEISAKLGKLPKHLGISIQSESRESVLSVLLRRFWVSSWWSGGHGKKDDDDCQELASDSEDAIDLQALAKVVSWASAANIPVVSLYDYEGELKLRHKELGRYINEEIAQDFWAVKQGKEDRELPLVKFHNVHKAGQANGHKNGYTNGHSNGVNGAKSQETLHIFIFSREDGKPGVVQATKNICLEQLDDGLKSCNELNGNSIASLVPNNKMSVIESCVNEQTLDSYLNRNNSWPSSIVEAKTEPELLMILGSVRSTLGFLPWHVRLTEFHWLPTLKRVGLSDFLESLQKYSNCQQRCGK